jgi:PTH1 family peptidyl-tRNA hydrolase
VRIVLGLGNPGPQYAGSRHNAGFDVVALLAERIGIRAQRERFGILFGDGMAAGRRVVLAQPLTFMNLSGEAAAPFLRYRNVEPDEGLAVVHDDIDLPCGRIKVKYGGGHGGHNGLRSLLAHLGTDRFARVRVGVGRPAGSGGEVVDHVLGRPSAEDRALLEESLETAADAVLTWIEEGPQAAMNRFNRPPPQPEGGGEAGDEEDDG